MIWFSSFTSVASSRTVWCEAGWTHGMVCENTQAFQSPTFPKHSEATHFGGKNRPAILAELWAPDAPVLAQIHHCFLASTTRETRLQQDNCWQASTQKAGKDGRWMLADGLLGNVCGNILIILIEIVISEEIVFGTFWLRNLPSFGISILLSPAGPPESLGADGRGCWSSPQIPIVETAACAKKTGNLSVTSHRRLARRRHLPSSPTPSPTHCHPS